jgi:hypothetical protein
MLDGAREAIAIAERRARDDPQGDRVLALALVKLIEIVGEAASKVTRPFQESHPGIPWRGKHRHQDCPWLGAGAVLHVRAQVDGTGLCVADVHAYQGQGELAFDGVGAAAAVRLRIERSTGWLVDWPLVETADEVMVCASGARYVEVVRQAYWALREVVAARAGCTVAEANSIVAAAADRRNTAVYGLGDGYVSGTVGQPSGDLASWRCNRSTRSHSRRAGGRTAAPAVRALVGTRADPAHDLPRHELDDSPGRHRGPPAAATGAGGRQDRRRRPSQAGKKVSTTR